MTDDSPVWRNAAKVGSKVYQLWLMESGKRVWYRSAVHVTKLTDGTPFPSYDERSEITEAAVPQAPREALLGSLERYTAS